MDGRVFGKSCFRSRTANCFCRLERANRNTIFVSGFSRYDNEVWSNGLDRVSAYLNVAYAAGCPTETNAREVSVSQAPRVNEFYLQVDRDTGDRYAIVRKGSNYAPLGRISDGDGQDFMG